MRDRAADRLLYVLLADFRPHVGAVDDRRHLGAG